jgi:hypothetical protein
MAIKFRTKEERDEYRDAFYAPASPVTQPPESPSSDEEDQTATSEASAAR